MKKSFLLGVFSASIFSFVLSTSVNAALVSDFDDGTLQGWTPEPPFNGTLFVDNSGGNPNGFMVATDSVGGGGGLLARAPSILSGDLSIYGGLRWDEFVYDNGSANRVSTFIIIKGADGTIYRNDNTLGPVGVWNSRFVSFSDPNQWTLNSGTATFSNTISNVDALFISMDTSVSAGGRESGIDNVSTIPIPAAVWLFGSGLIGLIGIARRKKS